MLIVSKTRQCQACYGTAVPDRFESVLAHSPRSPAGFRNDAAGMTPMGMSIRVIALGWTRQRKFSPDNSPLEQHVAPEPEQLGGPTACLRRNVSAIFDQSLLVDQPAEILFVQSLSGERLDRALQLKQCEFRRHQLEYHGTVFDFGSKPRDAGRQNAAMV